MPLPPDGSLVGWYRYSAAVAEEGITVLGGHVDTRAHGPGAFFTLGELGEGDEVTVTTESGATMS